MNNIMEWGSEKCLQIINALIEKKGMPPPPLKYYKPEYLLHRLVKSGQVTVLELEKLGGYV